MLLNKKYRQGRIRFFVLILDSACALGCLYSFNIPQALEDNYKQLFDIGTDQAKFNLLYTIFSIPVIVTAIPLGVLIDFIGIRKGLIIFTVGACLSQIACTVGVYTNKYSILLLGRAMLGITMEALLVAQAAMAGIWFKNKQLGLAIGTIITFPQIGDAMNSLLSPPLYQKTNSIVVPNWAGIILCFIGIVASILISLIDLRAQKADNQSAAIEKVNFQDIKKFGKSYWIITILLMICVSLFISFMANANSYFIHRFSFTQVTAGRVTMLTYIVCIITSPIIGIIVDKCGHRYLFIVVSTIIYLLSHSILFFYPSSDHKVYGPILGMILLGVSFAMYASCIYPAIADIVKQSALGTAYGIQTVMNAISMSIFPFVSGIIKQSNFVEAQGFKMISLFYMIACIIAICLSMVLLLMQRKYKKDRTSIRSQSTKITKPQDNLLSKLQLQL